MRCACGKLELGARCGLVPAVYYVGGVAHRATECSLVRGAEHFAQAAEKILLAKARHAEWNVPLQGNVDVRAMSSATRFLLHECGAEFDNDRAYFFWRQTPDEERGA